MVVALGQKAFELDENGLDADGLKPQHRLDTICISDYGKTHPVMRMKGGTHDQYVRLLSDEGAPSRRFNPHDFADDRATGGA